MSAIIGADTVELANPQEGLLERLSIGKLSWSGLNGPVLKKRKRYIIKLKTKPYIPDGWKVESHQRGRAFKKIHLHLSAQQKSGGIVEGNKLSEELKEWPCLNTSVSDWLLDHQELIPKKYRGKQIFFWGTIYRDSEGNLCVLGLWFDGESWRRRGRRIDCGFGPNDPAATAFE